ncbi:hypothetical protein D3C81_2186620 [compost metagenome]
MGFLFIQPYVISVTDAMSKKFVAINMLLTLNKLKKPTVNLVVTYLFSVKSI